MKNIILSACLFLNTSLFALNLDLDLPLTSSTGKLNTSVLARVKVGDSVVIKRGDGISYKATISEIIESPDFVKIHGTMINEDDIQFGIHLLKGGLLAGVIVENKTGKVYSLEFSAAHKGFIFIYSAFHSKLPV